MCSLLLISAGAQKKNTTSAKLPTTTKSVEAKNAVDALKKNPNPKKEVVIVYNADFEKGEELFQLNRPEAAIPYFVKSLDEANVNPAVYIYLGVCYYQVGDYNNSLAICVKGLAKENTDHKILAYNAGNSCYAMGNYMRADASYAIAIKEDPDYAPAVLNRANAQLKLDHLEDAKNNYTRYLELERDTDQREKIELLIQLLNEEIELRAKQKPELINPDSFVENEKMEVPDPLEKVFVELPAEPKSAAPSSELVQDDAHAPKLPEAVAQKDNGEKVTVGLLENETETEQKNLVSAAPAGGKLLAKTERTPAERIDAPEIPVPLSVKQSTVPVSSDTRSVPNSERVYDSEEQARFAEENRLALEAEKARLAEESRKELEAEKARLAEEARKTAEAEAARLAAEENERRRNEEMRLALEVEKARLAEEARKALEAEKARLAEDARKSLELEKARLEAEEAKRSLEAERLRLAEEARKNAEEAQKQIEAQKAQIAAEEAARLALEAEKARLAEETRKALEMEKARIVAEEAEKRRVEEARLALEAEKLRQAEESRKAAEAETARVRAAEAEKARAAEEQRKHEESRAAEEAKKNAEKEAARIAEQKAQEEARQKEIASWPSPVLSLGSQGAENFTPDGDGQNDTVVFAPSVTYLSETPKNWTLTILDPHGNAFRTISGTGSLPQTIDWDGTSDKGEVVLSKNTYTARLSVQLGDADKKRLGVAQLETSQNIETGLLLQVIVPGHEWKMVVNSINFVPNGALDTKKLTSEQNAWNTATLDEIAAQIKDHPSAKVVIVEGYANNISGTEKENREELMPLSQLRADAIVQELVKRGVDPNVLQATGMGGANPLASQEDHDNWWKNRRVEFRIKQ